VSLVAWFLLLSLLSVTVVSGASALLLARFLTERLLALDISVTTEFINHIFGVENADRYFVGAGTGGHGEELTRFFVHVGQMPDVLRANIYQLDGTVLWSTDRSIVGRRFADNEELAESAAGRPTFALNVAGEADDKEEHVNLPPGERFVENYIPMFRDGQSGKAVVGVLEIYRAPHAVLDAIRAGQRLVFGSAALGALLIIGTLCWLVYRADFMMRRQEAAIVEAERVATAGEMAAVVAHGLRNPLASIRSSAELAMRRLQSPERVQRLLDDIVLQSDRLEHWVRQYLSPNGGSAEGGSAALGLVLATVQAGHSGDLERLGIEWQVDLSADVPAVRMDAAALEQVLNSIVANAVQAMPEGGTLSVTARAAERGMVELRIADTGQGMSKEQLERAFVLFATSKRTGLGLGLALTRRLVERQGGRIMLTSELGRGTTVSLRLPAASTSEVP
jgi:signal transduction histidine kinase